MSPTGEQSAEKKRNRRQEKRSQCALEAPKRRKHSKRDTSETDEVHQLSLPSSKPGGNKSRLNFSKPNAEFVKIFVGREDIDTKPARFLIHRDAIMRSPYFKNAFTNPENEEAKTKIMKVTDTDEKVFGLFNNWLYFEEIEHADATEPGLMELALLWTAAEKWKLPALQNETMEKLSNMLVNEFNPNTKENEAILTQFLDHAYSTTENTPMKRLAVQKMIRLLPSVRSPKEWAADLPDGMFIDFTVALIRHHNNLPPNFWNPRFWPGDYLLQDFSVPIELGD